MKAYISPYVLICGSCGSVMHANRFTEKDGALKVRCLAAHCPEKNHEFVHTMETVELHPAPEAATA